MKITNKIFLCSLFVLLTYVNTYASILTLPSDFSSNSTAYPAVDSLPVYSTPGVLLSAGRIIASGTYFLNKDIYARAEGFVIEADNVTLDLRGHNIIYACENYLQAYGISLPPTYNHALFFPRGQFAVGSNNNFTLTDTIGGGSVVKGVGFPAEKSSAIFAYEGHGLTITNIKIDHSGIAASGIETHYLTGDVVIKGVTTNYQYVRDGTPIINPTVLRYPTGYDGIHWYWVLNRHSEIVGSIVLKESNMTNCTISNNNLLNSPQAGLYIADIGFTTPTQKRDNTFFDFPDTYAYKTTIANNHIDLNAKITNCYGLKLDTSDANIYNNSVTGYGAGIHVGGKHLYIHDNSVNVSQGANPEYPTRLWAHGLKIEGTTVSISKLLPDQCLITRNSITVRARGPLEYKDPTFWYSTTEDGQTQYFGRNGGARVLDLSPSIGTWNEIYLNTFRGERATLEQPLPEALRLTSVNMFSVVQSSVTVTNNTFETNGYFLSHDWPPADTKLDSIVINNNKYTDIKKVSKAQLAYISGANLLAPIIVKNPRADSSTTFLTNPNYSIWISTPEASLRIVIKDTLFREVSAQNGNISDTIFSEPTCHEIPSKCSTIDECHLYWPSYPWTNNKCLARPLISTIKNH